jgi:hypothetical protein
MDVVQGKGRADMSAKQAGYYRRYYIMRIYDKNSGSLVLEKYSTSLKSYQT